MVDERICPKHDHGAHIPLRCKNHPDLRWSTKNLAPIGARSIFYSSYSKGEECTCQLRDLEHVCEEES